MTDELETTALEQSSEITAEQTPEVAAENKVETKVENEAMPDAGAEPAAAEPVAAQAEAPAPVQDEAPDAEPEPEASEAEQHVAEHLFQTKDEVVARVKEIAQSEELGDKTELALLKQLFYRFHNAEVQEAFKAFVEAGGEADQEGRRGSEEVVPENFGVPLEGDRDVGALCGSHQG